MSSKLKTVWDTIVAEKWWFLGPILVFAVLMAALALMGGAGGQGFNYF